MLNKTRGCRVQWRLPDLELLHSFLQALGVEVGLFGGKLLLRRLEPPDEGAGEPAEAEQLLLTGLDGSEPEEGGTEGRRREEEERKEGRKEVEVE